VRVAARRRECPIYIVGLQRREGTARALLNNCVRALCAIYHTARDTLEEVTDTLAWTRTHSLACYTAGRLCPARRINGQQLRAKLILRRHGCLCHLFTIRRRHGEGQRGRTWPPPAAFCLMTRAPKSDSRIFWRNSKLRVLFNHTFF
jgi:hypothetical protein